MFVIYSDASTIRQIQLNQGPQTASNLHIAACMASLSSFTESISAFGHLVSGPCFVLYWRISHVLPSCSLSDLSQRLTDVQFARQILTFLGATMARLLTLQIRTASRLD